MPHPESIFPAGGPDLMRRIVGDGPPTSVTDELRAIRAEIAEVKAILAPSPSVLILGREAVAAFDKLARGVR